MFNHALWQVRRSDGFEKALERVLGCISSSHLCVIRCTSGFHRAPTLAGSVGDIVASWGTGESIRIIMLSENMYDKPRHQQHLYIADMIGELRAALLQWIGIGPGYFSARDIQDLQQVVDISSYRSKAGMKYHKHKLTPPRIYILLAHITHMREIETPAWTTTLIDT